MLRVQRRKIRVTAVRWSDGVTILLRQERVRAVIRDSVTRYDDECREAMRCMKKYTHMFDILVLRYARLLLRAMSLLYCR